MTVSHSSLICVLERVGKDFDEAVLKWKDHIVLTLNTSNDRVSCRVVVVVCKFSCSKPR